MEDAITIVGIIATNGSGKTTIATSLARTHGHTHHSVREYLLSLFHKKHGTLPASQAEIGAFGDALRQERGPEAAIAVIVENIISEGVPGVYIIESLRCPGEVHFLKKVAEQHPIVLKLVGIDAPHELRYNRLVQRGDFKAPKSIEEFKAMEQAEWNEPDPWKMSIGKCLDMVHPDARFENLDGELEQTLEKIQHYLMQ